MATVCLNFEELVYGHDGKAPNSAEAIEIAKAEAKDDGAERMEIEIRSEPRGTRVTKQEDAFRVPTSMSTAKMQAAILKRLTDSPGDGFSGTIRLNFRSIDDSHKQYKTYTRTIRVVEGADGAEGDDAKDPELVKAVKAYIAPLLDQIIRLNEVSIDRDKAGAQLISATAQVTAGFAHMLKPGEGANPGQGNLLMQMLGGAIKANAGEAPGGAAGKTAASAVGSFVAGGGTPPPSPFPRPTVAPPPGPGGFRPPQPGAPGSFVPPNNGSNLTRSQVEEWAEKNPKDAEAMVKKALAARGVTLPGL